MTGRLTLMQNNGKEIVIDVGKGESVTIGRGKACDVRILDTRLSRIHCKLTEDEGTFFIVDAGSTNGTFVNREKVERAELSDGDVVMIGTNKGRFTIVPGEAPPGGKAFPALVFCDECNGSIPRKELDAGLAREENGKYYCRACLAAREEAFDAGMDEPTAEVARVMPGEGENGVPEAGDPLPARVEERAVEPVSALEEIGDVEEVVDLDALDDVGGGDAGGGEEVFSGEMPSSTAGAGDAGDVAAVEPGDGGPGGRAVEDAAEAVSAAEVVAGPERGDREVLEAVDVEEIGEIVDAEEVGEIEDVEDVGEEGDAGETARPERAESGPEGMGVQVEDVVEKSPPAGRESPGEKGGSAGEGDGGTALEPAEEAPAAENEGPEADVHPAGAVAAAVREETPPAVFPAGRKAAQAADRGPAPEELLMPEEIKRAEELRRRREEGIPQVREEEKPKEKEPEKLIEIQEDDGSQWFLTLLGRRIGPIGRRKMTELKRKQQLGTLTEEDLEGL